MDTLLKMPRGVRWVLTAAALGMILSVVGRLLGVPVFGFLSLSAIGGTHTIWQLATHPFAFPASGRAVVGVLVSGFFFYWMGASLERRVGTHRLLQVVGASALASGSSAMICAMGLQALGVGVPSVAAHGLGAIVLAVLVALALTHPPRASLSLFGVLSLPRNALLAGVVGVALLVNLADANLPGVFGDLGAAGASFALIRRWRHDGRAPRVTHRRSERRAVRPVARSSSTRWRGRST